MQFLPSPDGLRVQTAFSESVYDPSQVARIEAACQQGKASLYASGIEPGFAGDHFVLTLTTMSTAMSSHATSSIRALLTPGVRAALDDFENGHVPTLS